MAQVQRASGVILDIPDGLLVVESATGRRRRRGEVTPGPATLLADVTSALESAEFAVVDTFELAAVPERSGRRRRGPGDPPEAATLTVGVDASESAAMLMEEDGYLSWHFPSAETPATGGRRRRRGEPSPGRQLTFELDLGTPTLAREERGRRRGIPILGRHIEKATAVVLRFVLPPVIGAVVGHLERNRLTRLVSLASTEATSWSEFTGLPPAIEGRPTKALLFIHGTFSSTAGGFGALSGTEWGRAFLANAIASYDIVLGHDHRTLSVDPSENAKDLLERLRTLWPDGAVDFDVICHSRGGLVFRSLVEKVIPGEPWAGTFGKTIFVAAANSGTELANPDNWNRLADLYTNLAGAAARGLAIISPGTAAASLVLAEVIDGVGTLVKTIVARGVQENDIPGLAAMWPEGPFIEEINKADPAQPQPASSSYFAVTSNFEPSLRDSDDELPARLVALLRDGLIDQLLHADNDAVVDLASMKKIDPSAGAFFDGSLDFGDNGAVYHTNYFHQETTVRAMGEWLDLAVAAQPGRRRRGGGGANNNDTIQVVLGQRTFDDSLVDELEASSARYVVIDREPYLRYAFRRDELRSALELAVASGRSGAPLEDAIELHEDMASRQAQEGETIVLRPAAPGEPPTRVRAVVLSAAGTPTGVAVPGEAMTATQLAALQAGITFPRPQMPAMANGGGAQPEVAVRRRRGGSRGEPRMPAEAAVAAEPESVTINAGAWTDSEIQLDGPATVTVTISREELALPAGVAAAVAAGEADPSKELKVMLIAAKNVKLAGASMQTTAVPEAGADPADLFFDVTGTNLGEARIDVVIRQTEAPIARLSLRPTVVANVAAAGTRAEASVSMTPSTAPGTPRHQLYINEEEHGGEVTYSFHLELLRPGEPPEPIMGESGALKGSKTAYIASLYKRIEDMWGDDRTEIARFAEQMRAEGGTLWDDLVPPKIKEALWEHRATIDSIQVYSDEPYIPWELVHMKEPGKRILPNESLFLGELGMVRWMWPSSDGVGCNRAPATLRIRRGKVAALIPEYSAASGWDLQSTDTELKTLNDVFGNVVRVPATSADLHSALTAGYDLIHYAGHGVGSSQDIGNEGLVLTVGLKDGKWQPDDTYRVQDIVSHAQLSEAPCADSRPIVMLNCCETGQSGYTLTSIGGMAAALLGAGAGVVISPLWSVDDIAAADFAKAFYAAMRAGNTLADAARAARTAIRNSGDQTWLAYTIYGEPTAKLA